MLVGVAMDAKRMSLGAPALLALGLYFAAGLVAGTLYFCCVWWNVRLYADHGSARMTVLLLFGRLLVLAAMLTLAASQGAMPLLLMALGVFVARFAVIRGLRAAAP
jgi:F1F0 ATPase subunit 2